MKKKLIFIITMALWLIAAPAWAENVDSSLWLKGEYIGVGSIDMTKFSQRRLYSHLMKFFVTHEGVKQSLEEIKAAGISLEKSLTRIVVGIPTDIEKSEHVILWETTEELEQYKSLVTSHPNSMDVRKYQDTEYYATKRENECFAMLGNILVLGSELRVKEIIEAHKSGYKSGPKNPTLRSAIKDVDKQKDAWFVFVVTDKMKQGLVKTDPVVDMSAGGLGTLRLSEIKKGAFAFDFSNGLNAKANFEVGSNESATQSARLLNAVIAEAGSDQDLKELGFDSFMTGIAFNAKKKDISVSVIYDQTKFDELITLVTQVMKSISSAK